MTARRTFSNVPLLSLLSALVVAVSLQFVATGHASELQDATTPIETLPPAARLLVVDTDGDGTVSAAEADSFAADYFAVIDTDRDGIVRRGEYVGAELHGVWWRWLSGVSPDVRASFLADGFTRRDLDGDGGVTVSEFVARTRTDYATSDDDSDGRVSPLEFHMLGLAI